MSVTEKKLWNDKRKRHLSNNALFSLSAICRKMWPIWCW